MYQKVSTDLNFVEREKQVEAFQKKDNIFEKSMENRKTAAQYKDAATVPLFPRKRSISTQIIGASTAVTVNAETLSDLKIENSRMLKPSVNITEQSNALEKSQKL